MTVKILLDTDIGTDIDDAVCLAYLLAQPEAELVGVTTVTGQAEKRAMMVSALCQIAGANIPIYPGAEKPLLVAPIQTEAQQAEALSNWVHDTEFPQNAAIDFMRQAIRAYPHEITLLAIGPLTNVALLFALDPQIPSLLKRLVIMNGYFLGDKKTPEWNTKLDPHASQMVYQAGVSDVLAVGIDVTQQVKMEATELRSRFDTKLLRPVLDFAEVWFRVRPHITFHDPLAATVIFDESICEYETGEITVELADSPIRGMTHWNPQKSGHRIARSVDVPRFFEHYFSVFK
jgi:purine nucleosidase